MLVTGTYIYIAYDYVIGIDVNDGCPSFEVGSATVLVGDQGEPLDLQLITLRMHGTRRRSPCTMLVTGFPRFLLDSLLDARSVEDFVIELQIIA